MGKVTLKKMAMEMAKHPDGMNFKEFSIITGLDHVRSRSIICTLAKNGWLVPFKKVAGSRCRPMTIYKFNREKAIREHLADALDSIAEALRLSS